MKKALIAIAAVLVLIQFIPVSHENPVSDPANEIPVAMDVKQLLKKSCYDCHSNQTVWPAYSYVAPVSWLVTNHVKDGRKHLNFSEWNTYDADKQNKKRDEIWEEVSEGEMPLPGYLILHAEAELTSTDLDLIKKWSQAEAPEKHEDIASSDSVGVN